MGEVEAIKIKANQYEGESCYYVTAGVCFILFTDDISMKNTKNYITYCNNVAD